MLEPSCHHERSEGSALPRRWKADSSVLCLGSSAACRVSNREQSLAGEAHEDAWTNILGCCRRDDWRGGMLAGQPADGRSTGARPSGRSRHTNGAIRYFTGRGGSVASAKSGFAFGPADASPGQAGCRPTHAAEDSCACATAACRRRRSAECSCSNRDDQRAAGSASDACARARRRAASRAVQDGG